MKYTIICMVVGWLFANFLATRNINGQPVFPGPQAVPWEFNGCRSPFECLALAVLVVILFRNVLGQRNIEPATTVRIKTTTRAPTTTTTRAPTTLVPGDLFIVCSFVYALCFYMRTQYPCSSSTACFYCVSLEIVLRKKTGY
ncbi:hypothetical protein ACJMK2_038911 [Sinanodonta woodiana]|uniref:Uncharacterized protein n=1 Tax=Sinanodonta woodiana TaxID=1069815 RepID=A0ABD3WAE6_SINWO